MHFNENSQRKQAKTKEGEDRWVVIYPKAHKGEKSIARKIKEEATYSKFNSKYSSISHFILPICIFECIMFYQDMIVQY